MKYVMGRYAFLDSLILAICLLVSASVLGADDGVSTAIQNLAQRGPAKHLKLSGHGLSSSQIDNVILEIYSKRDFQPLWLVSGRPSERAEVLRTVLDASSTEGLNPDKYRASWIRELWSSRDSTELAKLDLLLTLGLGGYVADASEGSLDPREVDAKLFANARDVDVDVVGVVKRTLVGDDLRTFLKSIPPQHQYYQSLRPALARYREIEREGGWKQVPQGQTLKLEMQDHRIPRIRQRLAITGDLTAADTSSDVFDATLEEAVKRFQLRHHLEEDGAIGKRTLEAMNVPVGSRIRQIAMNMERWRWTARDLGERQLLVNIAGYHVVGMRKEEIEVFIPVIVGKTYHKTPVFSDEIEYIEFNPFWNVPTSIARNEYLPQLRKNALVLQSKHIRIFDGWDDNAREIDPTTVDWNTVDRKRMGRYRLRQDPGAWNALGTVKFMFPNPHNVYLHDTPQHALFERNQRTFSHGCVRVSRPHELAVYILGGKEKGWDLERVKKIVDSGKRTIVKLDGPMPVHILYRTVVAMNDGIVRFREDVYGRDELLEHAFFRGG